VIEVGEPEKIYEKWRVEWDFLDYILTKTRDSNIGLDMISPKLVIYRMI
jgi:hypothetical protein